jgi:hypothetical protein
MTLQVLPRAVCAPLDERLWEMLFRTKMQSMARKLDTFPGLAQARGQRRYPWGEWADGSPWEIRRGEDYDVATENMRVNLHMRADSLRRKVRTRKFNDERGEGLIFQFADSEEAVEARELASQHSSQTRALIEQLYADAMEIYERARREVTIPRKDGHRQKYAPNRYRQQIERAYAEGQLVDAIGRIVRRRTDGFGHLEKAERPDLMLETLVLNNRKPYHPLFPEATVQAAKERMDDYAARHP